MSVKQLTFVDGQAPDCDADWLNSAEKEINNTISAAGITLNDADKTQLAQATGNFAVRAGWFIDSGTANAYVLTPQTTVKVHSGGQFLRFTFAPLNTNTGASTAVITFSDGATTAKPILDINGDALVGGELVATYPVDCYYDGTNVYILQSFAFLPKEYLVDSGRYVSAGGTGLYSISIPAALATDNCKVEARGGAGTSPVHSSTTAIAGTIAFILSGADTGGTYYWQLWRANY
jgi:hypothetical protein